MLAKRWSNISSMPTLAMAQSETDVECRLWQAQSETDIDQRLANLGIKHRQLWPNLLLGKCHINVGPTLKQCLAG